MKKVYKNIICFSLILFSSFNVFAQDTNRTGTNGKREGKWIGYYEGTNNKRYEGVFENGIEQGVFVFYDDSPSANIIAKRDFSKGNGVAFTTFYDAKGKKVSEGNFKGKEKDGKWIYFHIDGKTIMSEENYVNGKLEGIRKVYYKSGKPSDEMNYKNGVLEGKLFKYAENGQVISEEIYVNDSKHGKAIYRNASGVIVEEVDFDNGRIIKSNKKP